MKTFAIILLMLCSFSFLKAQTMVVETVDSVVSFEVGEIKSLSAFKMRATAIWFEMKNIPIIANYGSNNQEISVNYHTFLSSHASIVNDTLISTSAGYMEFTFYRDVVKEGSGNPTYTTNIILEKDSNSIKSFHIKTIGSAGSNASNPNQVVYVFGELEMELENLPFTITDKGTISCTITGKDIVKYFKKFIHREERKDRYSITPTEFLRFVEDNFTESSVLKITFL